MTVEHQKSLEFWQLKMADGFVPKRNVQMPHDLMTASAVFTKGTFLARVTHSERIMASSVSLLLSVQQRPTWQTPDSWRDRDQRKSS